MKKIPFNIYSIEDIDEWRKEFFFPISLSLCERIEKKLCSTLIKQYNDIEDKYKPHYRIASKAIILESYDLLVKLIVANEMKNQDDFQFILSNHRLPLDASLPERNITFELYRGNNNIYFPNLELKYNDPYYQNISTIKKIGQHLKNINEYNFRRRKNHSNNYIIIPNDTTIKYVTSLFKSDYNLLRPFVIFKKSLGKKYRLNSCLSISSIAAWLRSEINAIFYKITSKNITQNINKLFEKSIFYLFNRIDYELGLARRFCDKYIKSDINLYTGTAKHFTRIISETVRERGGTVTAFPHEGGLSGLNLPVLTFTEFATCDSFVCFDELDALDYEKYPKINSIGFPIIGDLGESVLNIHESKLKKSEKIDLSRISTIMYVFYGQHIDNFASGTRNDLQGFDLQLKIIDYLIKLNKKIIFKNRPKTVSQSNSFNHFGYYNGRVEYTATPFKQVLHDADLFILEGIGTASLHEAMTLTNTPIILFKSAFPKCTDEYERKLNERCYVINLFEDKSNRFCFDIIKFKNLFYN